MPTGIAVDALVNIYISNWSRIGRVKAAAGTFQTIAGQLATSFGADGGSASEALSWHPVSGGFGWARTCRHLCSGGGAVQQSWRPRSDSRLVGKKPARRPAGAVCGHPAELGLAVMGKLQLGFGCADHLRERLISLTIIS